MSTHARPIVFVGKEFENEIEALYFLQKHHFFTEAEVELIESEINNGDCALEDCINEKYKKFPDAEVLNYVTDEGYFIGYNIAHYKTEDDMHGFLNDIQAAQEQWFKLFKEEGAVCIRVQTS